MKTQSTDEVMSEEMKEARTNVEKQMILQKYGVIEPKLTAQEKADIMFEQGSYNVNGGYSFVKGV